MSTRQLVTQSFYQTTLSEAIVASSWDITFHVTAVPTDEFGNRITFGFFVISPNNIDKREYFWAHDISASNVVSVRGINRINPKTHSIWEYFQMNDLAGIFNFYGNLAPTVGYIERVAALSVKVWWGPALLAGVQTTLNDVTLVFWANQTNKVYLDLADNTFKTTTGSEYLNNILFATVETNWSVITNIQVNRPTLLSWIKWDAWDDGRAIVSINKTNTVGLTDTYTITYSEWSPSTFNVVNGAAGAAWANGADGADWTDWVGISSVTKISTVWNIDTYRILFSDASTSDFTVTNGSITEWGGPITTVDVRHQVVWAVVSEHFDPDPPNGFLSISVVNPDSSSIIYRTNGVSFFDSSLNLLLHVALSWTYDSDTHVLTYPLFSVDGTTWDENIFAWSIAYTNITNNFYQGSIFREDVVFMKQVSFPFKNIGTIDDSPADFNFDGNDGSNQKVTLQWTTDHVCTLNSLRQGTYVLFVVQEQTGWTGKLTFEIGTDCELVDGVNVVNTSFNNTTGWADSDWAHIFLILVAETRAHISYSWKSV